jgi:GxxExxY protein
VPGLRPGKQGGVPPSPAGLWRTRQGSGFRQEKRISRKVAKGAKKYMMENETAKQVVDASLLIHKALGPGLLESVYEAVLYHELVKRGLQVQRQVPVTFVYDETRYDEGFRIDLLAEDCVIIEIKSVEDVHPVHQKQLLTYLRLSKKRLGLLINFNTILLKNGIIRMVNGLSDSP